MVCSKWPSSSNKQSFNDYINSSIYAAIQRCLPNTLLDITRKEENKQKKRLNKRRDIHLDDCNEINEEGKIEDCSTNYLNNCNDFERLEFIRNIS